MRDVTICYGMTETSPVSFQTCTEGALVFARMRSQRCIVLPLTRARLRAGVPAATSLHDGRAAAGTGCRRTPGCQLLPQQTRRSGGWAPWGASTLTWRPGWRTHTPGARCRGGRCAPGRRPHAAGQGGVSSCGQLHAPLPRWRGVCRPRAASAAASPHRVPLLRPLQVGELCVRGYSVMLGYWGDPAATSAAIDEASTHAAASCAWCTAPAGLLACDATSACALVLQLPAAGRQNGWLRLPRHVQGRWMHTGDLAVLDGQGYCSIVGRIKDMASPRCRRCRRRCRRSSCCCCYGCACMQPRVALPSYDAPCRSSEGGRMCTRARWKSSCTCTPRWQTCRLIGLALTHATPSGGGGGLHAHAARRPDASIHSTAAGQAHRVPNYAPALAPAQVFGVPDAKWGEELCAWVRLR